MLGLHGHIHESQAAARIGRTVCVNPGSEYGEGVLRGCLITIADGKVDELSDDRRLRPVIGGSGARGGEGRGAVQRVTALRHTRY